MKIRNSILPGLLALLFLPNVFLNAQVGELPEEKQNEPPRKRVDEQARYKGSAILLHMGFGYQAPGGDLADRFDNNGVIGLGLEYITTENWIWGGEGHMFFGNNVNEDPLSILRTPEGDIIGNDRLLASVVLRERGWYYGMTVGKLFPLLKEKRSGIRVSVSAGWTQHKIRIQDDSRTVNQLTGDYIKGYDRLTGGFALNEFIGWQQIGRTSGFNFMLGFELNQGFTNTLRSWDFSENRKMDESRLDLRFGIRANWTLPFYLKSSDKIYY